MAYFYSPKLRADLMFNILLAWVILATVFLIVELLPESISPYLFSWLGLAQYYWDLLCLFLSVDKWTFTGAGVLTLFVLSNSAELLESFEFWPGSGDANSSYSSIGLAI